MFLLIGESLGWSELIMIGIVALILLGPRKLPQLARTAGKYMADFRRTTDEFKKTWEREVELDKEEIGQLNPATWLKNPIELEDEAVMEKTNSKTSQQVPLPEIKNVSQENLSQIKIEEKEENKDSESEQNDNSMVSSNKRDWL